MTHRRIGEKALEILLEHRRPGAKEQRRGAIVRYASRQLRENSSSLWWVPEHSHKFAALVL